MPLPILALLLGTFALGTTEFVVAGLLPLVAADLAVSVPTAGFIVTGYALGVAAGGPVFALAASRVSARAALLGLLALFTLGQVACALAPGFAWLLAIRVLVAACHGAFFGIAAVLATRMMPPERSGRAVAVLLAGVTAANVLGVPAGTAIGGLLGWRFAFWAVFGLGAVALLAVAGWVPDVPRGRAGRNGLANQLSQLLKPAVYLSALVIILSMLGQLALFAYVASYVTTVAGAAPEAIPLFLLIYGVGSTLGVVAGGRLADWRLMPSLLTILCLQALVYLLIGFTGGGGGFMLVLALLWGCVAYAFAAPAQAQILRSARAAPVLASALIPTAFNIGIALGAAGGSLALQVWDTFEVLPWIGVAASSGAALLALVAWRLETGDAAPVPAPQPQQQP